MYPLSLHISHFDMLTPFNTESTRSQDTPLIRTRLRGRTRRDRIELPRNVIRVIEADVLAMGHWIFLDPIVAYPGTALGHGG
jgi:hypothetical protein